MDMIIVSENLKESTCMKCLKEIKEDKFTYNIYGMGYGSIFDNFNTKVILCNECYKDTDIKIWTSEQVVAWNIDNHKFMKLKYEDEIQDYIENCPIQGQELFYNRLSSGGISFRIDAQDWIDHQLGLLSNDKYKAYGFYSFEEIEAYHNRFPTCKNVFDKVYADGSIGSKCNYGARGEEGKVCDINVSDKCCKCNKYTPL